MDDDQNSVVEMDDAGQIGSDGEATFQCPHCSKSFKRGSTLTRHVKSKCGTLKAHVCEHCEKGFDRADSLKRHIITCLEKISTWQCDRCGKVFPYQCRLKRHLESCKKRCDKCGEKVEENVEHTCRLLVKLPKVKGKGTKSFVSSSQYIEPEHLNSLMELSMLLDVDMDEYTDFEISTEVDQSSCNASKQMVSDIKLCNCCYLYYEKQWFQMVVNILSSK